MAGALEKFFDDAESDFDYFTHDMKEYFSSTDFSTFTTVNLFSFMMGMLLTLAIVLAYDYFAVYLATQAAAAGRADGGGIGSFMTYVRGLVTPFVTDVVHNPGEYLDRR